MVFSYKGESVLLTADYNAGKLKKIAYPFLICSLLLFSVIISLLGIEIWNSYNDYNPSDVFSGDSGSTGYVLADSLPKAAGGALIFNGNSDIASYCAGNASQDGLSWSSAYIIENKSITLTNFLDAGISLSNTDVYTVFRNITIESVVGLFTYGIKSQNSKHVKFQNISLKILNYGIHLSDVSDFHLFNMTLGDCKFLGYLDNVSHSDLLSINISPMVSQNTDFGFDIRSSANLFMETLHLNVSGKYYTMRFSGNLNVTLTKSVFYLDSAPYQGIILTDSGSPGRELYFLDNIFYNALTYVFLIDMVSTYKIYNNLLSEFNAKPNIVLADSVGGKIYNNTLGKGGITFGDNNTAIEIPLNNTIDGKAIRYFENAQSLSINPGNIAQLILNNVNDSDFTGFTTHGGYDGEIIVRSCNNIGISEVNSSSSLYNGNKILVAGSDDITIDNALYRQGKSVIKTDGGSGLEVRNCNFNNITDKVVYISGATDIVLSDNSISDSEFPITISNTNGVLMRNNNMENVSNGVSFSYSHDLDADLSNLINGYPMLTISDNNSNDYKVIRDLTLSQIYMINGSYFLFSNITIENAVQSLTLYDSENVLVQDLYYGGEKAVFRIDQCRNITLVHSTFMNGAEDAIAISDSSEVKLIKLSISHFEYYGIYSEDSPDLFIHSNNITSITSAGIYLDCSTNATLSRNFINNTGDEALYISQTSSDFTGVYSIYENWFTYCGINNSANVIALYRANNASITDNRIAENHNNSVYMYNCVNITIENNTYSDATFDPTIYGDYFADYHWILNDPIDEDHSDGSGGDDSTDDGGSIDDGDEDNDSDSGTTDSENGIPDEESGLSIGATIGITLAVIAGVVIMSYLRRRSIGADDGAPPESVLDPGK